MGQITEIFSLNMIKQMETFYHNYLKSAPAHAIFQAKTPNAVITAYKSGKVLFQGSTPEIEADKWMNSKVGSGTDSKKQPTRNDDDNINFLAQSHIGSDESGTGDYFGPITTCAVYVRDEQIELLKEIGIQDSKAITDKKIKELSGYLMEMSIPYSLMILHNQKYNTLQQRGWTQGKMKTMLHYACIDSLLKKIGDAPYAGILIDQFCLPPVFIKHLKSESKSIQQNVHFMTKAESYSIAVAAASVIARASFVQEMEKLSAVAGVPLLKGASGKVDQLAASIIREQGEGILNKIAKVHFANTKKAMGLV